MAKTKITQVMMDDSTLNVNKEVDMVFSIANTLRGPYKADKYKDIIIAGGQGVTEQDYVNFLTSLKGISEFDVSDKLDQIKCPVLVMGAGEDQVVGVQSSLDIVDKLGCKYFIYEGYGHGVYDEAPDYLSHIKEFLDEQ